MSTTSKGWTEFTAFTSRETDKTDTTSEQKDVIAELVGLAHDDWTHIGFLAGAVARRLGPAAATTAIAEALGELAGILIDHDVVPGDLGADPDFSPWPGTKEERVARIVDETLALGRYPLPAEIAWFHYEPDAR